MFHEATGVLHYLLKYEDFRGLIDVLDPAQARQPGELILAIRLREDNEDYDDCEDYDYAGDDDTDG